MLANLINDASCCESTLTKSLRKSDSHAVCRSRVLAGDDQSIDNDLLAPGLGSLDIVASHALDLVLEQHGHVLGHVDGVLLGVAEASDLAALEKGLAAVDGDVDEDDGAVAHGRDGLAGLVELLDDLERGLVVDEVEHGAVAAGVEDGVELGRLSEELAERPRLLPELLLGVEELDRRRVGLEHLDGALVEGRDSSGGGGHYDFDVVLLVIADEGVVRVGELGLEWWMFSWGAGQGNWVRILTRYHPVGMPLFILSRLVRTTRIFLTAILTNRLD